MFFSNILYLIVLSGLPFLCFYLNKKIETKKNQNARADEINKIDKIIRTNNIIFYLIATILTVLSIFTFNTHLAEPLMAALYVDICVKIMGSKIYNIYHHIHDNSLMMKIGGLLLMPIILMTSLRNYFDTYIIGMWLFGIGDFIFLLYEVICVTLINLANIFINKYHNAYYFLTYLSIIFVCIFFIY